MTGWLTVAFFLMPGTVALSREALPTVFAGVGAILIHIAEYICWECAFFGGTRGLPVKVVSSQRPS